VLIVAVETAVESLRKVAKSLNGKAVLDLHIYVEDRAKSDVFPTVSCAGDVFPLPSDDSTRMLAVFVNALGTWCLPLAANMENSLFMFVPVVLQPMRLRKR
jgi:hypothetical protein